MIINHNTRAINTYNRMNENSKLNSKAMSKISSGLRINSAADDSAGAGISQAMKSMIRGLEQAERNVQDGISLTQTAEGGLAEIENPNIQRMRELVIQGANGTLTSEDKEKIQKEVDAIKASINDIANNTEFNGIKVLSPPITKTPGKPSVGKADIVFVVDNTGSMSNTQVTIANNINDFISSIESKGVTDVRIGVVEYKDSLISKISFSGSKWTSSPSEVANALINISTTNSGGTENTMAAITEAANYYDFRENDAEANNKHIVIITNESGDDNNHASNTGALLKNLGIQLHGVYYDTDPTFSTFNSLVDSTGGKAVNLADSGWGSSLSSILGEHIGSVGSIIQEDEVASINLQVGASKGDNFVVELFDARTEKLGLHDIAVDPFEEAQKAISKIDNAIELVSSQRAKFGAYENSLQHIGSNVSNYKDNITSAESRISDANIAKEVMNLTQSRILLESSGKLLAQSNEIVKGVLELLK